MQDINYLSPKYKKIIDKELSIQLSLNGFSFLVKSKEDGECLAYKHHKLQNIKLIDELIRKADSIIATDPLLSNTYTSAIAFFIDQKATLVPQEFFDVNNLRKFYEFNQSLGEYDELNYNIIPSAEAYTVFSLPNYLSNSFYNVLPNIKFLHQSTKLIEIGIKHSSDLNVVLGLNAGFFDIAIIEQNSLLLYNSFEYTNPQDFIYFFLYPLFQLKLDPSEIIVSLVGEESQNKAIIEVLKTKVHSITYPCSQSNCSKLVKETEQRFSYTLFF